MQALGSQSIARFQDYGKHIPNRQPDTSVVEEQLLMKNDRRMSYIKALEMLVERREAEVIFKQLSSIVKEYLDVTTGYSRQNKAKVYQFIKRSCEEYPLFRRFQNQWPLYKWLYNHLRAKRALTRSSLVAQGKENHEVLNTVSGARRGNNWQVPLSAIRASQTGVSLGARYTTVPNSSSVQSYPGMQCPGQTQVNQNPTTLGCAGQRDELAPCQKYICPDSPCPVRSSGCPSEGQTNFQQAEKDKEDTSQFVKHFLSNLGLVNDLWPVFEELGIVSEMALRTVARWVREQDESPLRRLFDDAKITWYQYQRLREALGKNAL